jgi:PAS domain S-box-containing protein
MRRVNSVVRKLGIVVIAIVTLVVAATGLVNNIIGNHYALESARAMLQFNSESILSGIGKLMMTRNNDGVSELIQDISKGSSVYQDIRLVSHYSGEIVVSRLHETGAILDEEDPSCAICHEESEPLTTSADPRDEVIPGPDGTRILHVITPIMNRAGCQNAECHEHLDSGPTLGFLHTEYSLGRVDSLISGLNTSFVVAALAAILLGTMALWIMFDRTLSRPIRYMLSGIQAIAGNDLSFRFKTDRKDEFGLVEESFDHMAARIQAHQTELRDAREYLEGIVENSADLIITVNPQGLIQTVNRGAEQALGYQRDELIGQRIELLFADPRERDVAITKLLQSGDDVTNYETRFLTKDKKVRNVLLTLSRLRDRDGAAIGTIGISKDITNEKDLQIRLAHSEKAAAIGQAVTAIQHAIKNMLNTLTGGSYLARSGISKNDEQRMEDGLTMIDEGKSRIESLSMNMLKYAKEWKLELEVADLAPIVEDVCNGIRQAGSGENATVRLHVSDHLPPVSCDQRLFHMALMDIASNALDACSSKRYQDAETAEIGFDVYRDKNGRFVVVEIRDNGIGMTEEIKTGIFTPFFSTKEDQGTGLGLSLALRIINLHGGEIDVESEPDKGSQFRIALPVAGMNTNEGAKDAQEGHGHR